MFFILFICTRKVAHYLYLFLDYNYIQIIFLSLFREVIPGATSPLSNFIVLNALNCAIEMGIQKVPGNQQQYFPHVRKSLPISSHHVIFNYLDIVLQTMENR